MRIYFDSSAFAKRFIDEPGSQEIDNLCQKASVVGLSIICYPEILSALNRRLREESLNKKEDALVKKRLSEELGDIQIINITPDVILRTEAIMETHVLRAMDALHVACALEWQAGLFVTSDRRQEKAAKRSGLKVKFID